ncbi:MAG: UDP-N-acetylmuramoyl-tripeptide--D-alanyl-D-alanine ligase [Acidobacteriota bacterium]|nr:UDP-N-acetylmuramoyl-tripeptide--D-alanyl-D-alanine ligase [Acidobacteriota bacterium]
MIFSIAAIAEKIGAGNIAVHSPSGEASNTPVAGWSIDSRSVNPGDCFFALRGPRRDGHDYVANVLERGASVAIVDHPVAANIPQLVVPDTLVALQQLAAKACRRWGGTVVGVTGSAGKTTTKDAIASLLNVQIKTGRTFGNYNNHYGVPLSILRLSDDCRAAVIEMGMNHAGEIRELAAIAKPRIGVVTNVGWAHAEYFEDGIEGVALAKRELIESLPGDGIAVLNADDQRVRAFREIHPGRSILFGYAEDAEVRAENVRQHQNAAHFQCLGVDFESPLAGRHGVSNVLAAIAVARALDIPPERLRDAVRALAAGKMRGERIERDGVTLINDCYNANPEAMRSMLELLRDTPARRRIAVLGEMLELGREAGTLHRGIGQFAAEQGIHALLGVRGAARFMVDGAVEAGMSGSAASFFNTPEAAGDFLRTYILPGDAILFKGSRGVEVEKAIERAFAEAKT